MKYWPSTDPRSQHYPGDLRKYNEAAGKRHQIQILREMAFKAMDPEESRRLYKAADDLSQMPLPIKIMRRADTQLSLFGPEAGEDGKGGPGQDDGD